MFPRFFCMVYRNRGPPLMYQKRNVQKVTDVSELLRCNVQETRCTFNGLTTQCRGSVQRFRDF